MAHQGDRNRSIRGNISIIITLHRYIYNLINNWYILIYTSTLKFCFDCRQSVQVPKQKLYQPRRRHVHVRYRTRFLRFVEQMIMLQKWFTSHSIPFTQFPYLMIKLSWSMSLSQKDHCLSKLLGYQECQQSHWGHTVLTVSQDNTW